MYAHICDELCFCHEHEVPLLYCKPWNLHTCVYPGCEKNKNFNKLLNGYLKLRTDYISVRL